MAITKKPSHWSDRSWSKYKNKRNISEPKSEVVELTRTSSGDGSDYTDTVTRNGVVETTTKSAGYSSKTRTQPQQQAQQTAQYVGTVEQQQIRARELPREQARQDLRFAKARMDKATAEGNHKRANEISTKEYIPALNKLFVSKFPTKSEVSKKGNELIDWVGSKIISQKTKDKYTRLTGKKEIISLSHNVMTGEVTETRTTPRAEKVKEIKAEITQNIQDKDYSSMAKNKLKSDFAELGGVITHFSKTAVSTIAEIPKTSAQLGVAVASLGVDLIHEPDKYTADYVGAGTLALGGEVVKGARDDPVGFMGSMVGFGVAQKGVKTIVSLPKTIQHKAIAGTIINKASHTMKDTGIKTLTTKNAPTIPKGSYATSSSKGAVFVEKIGTKQFDKTTTLSGVTLKKGTYDIYNVGGRFASKSGKTTIKTQGGYTAYVGKNGKTYVSKSIGKSETEVLTFAGRKPNFKAVGVKQITAQNTHPETHLKNIKHSKFSLKEESKVLNNIIKNKPATSGYYTHDTGKIKLSRLFPDKKTTLIHEQTHKQTVEFSRKLNEISINKPHQKRVYKLDDTVIDYKNLLKTTKKISEKTARKQTRELDNFLTKEYDAHSLQTEWLSRFAEKFPNQIINPTTKTGKFLKKLYSTKSVSAQHELANIGKIKPSAEFKSLKLVKNEKMYQQTVYNNDIFSVGVSQEHTKNIIKAITTKQKSITIKSLDQKHLSPRETIKWTVHKKGDVAGVSRNINAPHVVDKLNDAGSLFKSRNLGSFSKNNVKIEVKKMYSKSTTGGETKATVFVKSAIKETTDEATGTVIKTTQKLDKGLISSLVDPLQKQHTSMLKNIPKITPKTKTGLLSPTTQKTNNVVSASVSVNQKTNINSVISLSASQSVSKLKTSQAQTQQLSQSLRYDVSQKDQQITHALYMTQVTQKQEIAQTIKQNIRVSTGQRQKQKQETGLKIGQDLVNIVTPLKPEKITKPIIKTPIPRPIEEWKIKKPIFGFGSDSDRSFKRSKPSFKFPSFKREKKITPLFGWGAVARFENITGKKAKHPGKSKDEKKKFSKHLRRSGLAFDYEMPNLRFLSKNTKKRFRL